MKIVLLEPLFISDEILNGFAKELEVQGHEFTAYSDRVEDVDKIIERAEGANILMIGNLPLPEKVIRSLPDLKMISIAFTGVDHVAIEACQERGISVSNSAGYSTDSVAELAFGLMLSVLRNIVPCDKVTREGKSRVGLVGSDLCGKTLGIVGSGAIGLKTAIIGKAFGCKLLYYSRTEKDNFKELGAEFVSLDQLLSKSDVISLHVPLTAETKHLINAKKIKLMKKTAILVNTARGPVVDSQALTEALNDGEIAGAGIDVFDIEPPLTLDEPLLRAKNTVLAPHVAFATKEAFERRADIVFANIQAWFNGNPENVIL